MQQISKNPFFNLYIFETHHLVYMYAVDSKITALKDKKKCLKWAFMYL